MPSSNIIIIGSGISALTAAYQLSLNKNVIIITKSKVTDSNSILAQGGVASSVGIDDSWRSHFNDTVSAGCYHNKESAVEILVQNGPGHLLKLINDGMEFDRDEDQNLLLGKEGAHSTRRILHAGGDATGRALVLHMLEKVKERVQIIEDLAAIDFLIENDHCIGVKAKSQDNAINDYFADYTILATGGCGGLYSFSSNDKTIMGDGLAMAFRAGAELCDLEFIQFHPTLLHKDGKSCGLVSEAVRGEGAILVDEDGRPIMNGLHPMLDLAPRDVVARAIFNEICNGKKIYLDISMIDDFASRFPTITNLCIKNKIQIENGLIPVVPGAHFSMGGVKTNPRGQTTIPNLYAIGEVACNGVHGANRLASNSLLEGIVFGNIVANEILVDYKPNGVYPVTKGVSKKDYTLNLPSKAQIQTMMMENVGIVRNDSRLQYALEWFEKFKQKFDEISPSSLTIEQLEIVNMITVGWLIASSAKMRTESKGSHFREDYPFVDDKNWYKKDIIRKKDIENIVYS